MNPTVNDYLSLLISANSSRADLHLLLDACEDYMLNKSTAQNIVAEVTDTVRGWKSIATRLGISKTEQVRFQKRFTKVLL